MLARIPQSGDSSGAALGVRSVALLQIAKWSRSLHTSRLIAPADYTDCHGFLYLLARKLAEKIVRGSAEIRNLINLIFLALATLPSWFSEMDCHRSLFRHDANAMTIHRYAIQAYLI